MEPLLCVVLAVGALSDQPSRLLSRPNPVTDNASPIKQEQDEDHGCDQAGDEEATAELEAVAEAQTGGRSLLGQDSGRLSGDAMRHSWGNDARSLTLDKRSDCSTDAGRLQDQLCHLSLAGL